MCNRCDLAIAAPFWQYLALRVGFNLVCDRSFLGAEQFSNSSRGSPSGCLFSQASLCSADSGRLDLIAVATKLRAGYRGRTPGRAKPLPPLKTNVLSNLAIAIVRFPRCKRLKIKTKFRASFAFLQGKRGSIDKFQVDFGNWE